MTADELRHKVEIAILGLTAPRAAETAIEIVLTSALDVKPETLDDPLIHKLYKAGWATGVEDKTDAILSLLPQDKQEDAA